MTDSEIFMVGYDYARLHPGAPCIPPASITAIRPMSVENGLPSTSTVWNSGWKAGTRGEECNRLGEEWHRLYDSLHTQR